MHLIKLQDKAILILSLMCYLNGQGIGLQRDPPSGKQLHSSFPEHYTMNLLISQDR